MATVRDKRKTGPPAPWPVSLTVRIASSGALACHLLAVFAGPMYVGPRSELGARLHAWVRPYNEIHYLDAGYKFFDEPGPSHRIEYQLEFADGRQKVVGVFPDRDVHWPRLLYHRHFMLSESQNAMTPDARAAAELAELPPDSLPRRLHAIAVKTADTYARSYAHHLLHDAGASRVTLFGLRRAFPWPADVAAGSRLDDPRLVTRIKLGSFTLEDTRQ